MAHFLYGVSKEYDNGNKGTAIAAKVKLALPKISTKIALDAIQLHGGYGYSREISSRKVHERQQIERDWCWDQRSNDHDHC